MNDIQDLLEQGHSFLKESKFDLALGFFEQALLLNQNDPDLELQRRCTSWHGQIRRSYGLF